MDIGPYDSQTYLIRHSSPFWLPLYASYHTGRSEVTPTYLPIGVAARSEVQPGQSRARKKPVLRGVAGVPNGSVYVADRQNHRIQKFIVGP